MKKVFFIWVMAGVMALTPAIVNAQSQKEINKERKELLKQSKAKLNKRASKAARKEARKLVKQGWMVTPGALPVAKQIDKSYLMQYEYDDTGYPTYIMGEAMSIGENYDAAKIQALELAKQNLAGQIQTEVTALIENTVANKQLAAEQAASISQSVLASKNLISQNLGRVIPVVEAYRTKSNKNKEVLVRIAYNSKMALEAAKSAIRQDLEKKGEDLHEQLDKVLGF
ncbi:MAG: hypothetical protein LBS43_11560 [Prevotellaceae bacterium]|jgi:hypothetical protein|nr:hypothetical protein [Prevotellaceae bacterium]